MNPLERLRGTAESVCLKLIYKYTKRMDDDPPNEFGYKARATYIYLKQHCAKTAPTTIGVFDTCFQKALKEQLIWEINGLYTTKRPTQRTIDDEWDF